MAIKKNDSPPTQAGSAEAMAIRPGAQLLPRPWAAYTLGLMSYRVRGCQMLFWSEGGRYDGQYEVDDAVIDGMLHCGEDLQDATIRLTQDVPPTLLTKIDRAVSAILDFHTAMLAAYEERPEDFGVGTAPGENLWKELRGLADHSLAANRELKPWYTLGAEVGWYEFAMVIRLPHQPFPSFRSVVVAAASPGPENIEHSEVLKRLASFADKPDPLDPDVVASTALGYSPEPEQGGSQVVSLASALYFDLRDMPAAEATQGSPCDEGDRALTAGEAAAEPSGEFVMTNLQKSIWKALDGRALNTTKLAFDCKCERSRLYKPGGLQEMRKARLVLFKHGVGMYRPDAPPLDRAVPLNSAGVQPQERK